MRKLRTSGSVGGRAGNRSVYPTRKNLRTVQSAIKFKTISESRCESYGSGDSLLTSPITPSSDNGVQSLISIPAIFYSRYTVRNRRRR